MTGRARREERESTINRCVESCSIVGKVENRVANNASAAAGSEGERKGGEGKEREIGDGEGGRRGQGAKRTRWRMGKGGTDGVTDGVRERIERAREEGEVRRDGIEGGRMMG